MEPNDERVKRARELGLPTPETVMSKFALSGRCDNGNHSACPYPDRCRCDCHAGTETHETCGCTATRPCWGHADETNIIPLNEILEINAANSQLPQRIWIDFYAEPFSRVYAGMAHPNLSDVPFVPAAAYEALAQAAALALVVVESVRDFRLDDDHDRDTPFNVCDYHTFDDVIAALRAALGKEIK